MDFSYNGISKQAFVARTNLFGLSEMRSSDVLRTFASDKVAKTGDFELKSDKKLKSSCLKISSNSNKIKQRTSLTATPAVHGKLLSSRLRKENGKKYLIVEHAGVKNSLVVSGSK